MRHRIILLACTALCMLCLFSCDKQRVFERNDNLADGIWQENDVRSYQFKIPDTTLQYSIYLNVRSSNDYPYQNLFFSYTLKDARGNALDSALVEETLYDPVTGKPLGQGFGNMSDMQIPLLQNKNLADTGTYLLTVQQFMRTDALEGVHAVGARVERATP